ncbi:MAG: FAD:protein FMN transferase [Acidimicrobiales bacterium]
MTAPVLHVEQAMGTVFSFTVHPGTDLRPEVNDAIGASCERLHHAEALFSTWIPDSPMSSFRRGELAAASCPSEFAEVLDLCTEARQRSGSWFDPWSLPGGYDPTGLVKGWAIERALSVLIDAGVTSAMINGGGDIATWGRPASDAPWRIGIRHPWSEQALACIIEVESAIATSGTYERGLHLVDPHRGIPAVGAASASVTGPRLAFADAYATALAVGGDDAFDLIDGVEGYDAYLIRPDGSERASPGIAVVS